LEQPIWSSSKLNEESDFSFYNMLISFLKSIKWFDLHIIDTTANKLGKDPLKIPNENKTLIKLLRIYF
jgi:hypothetical protein